MFFPHADMTDNSCTSQPQEGWEPLLLTHLASSGDTYQHTDFRTVLTQDKPDKKENKKKQQPNNPTQPHVLTKELLLYSVYVQS